MRSLGPLESEVMSLLWEADEALTVRQVLDNLRDRDLAYTTVATVLENLYRKGWVTRRRLGRVWHYRARIASSDHAASVMREALAASKSPRATFLKFVDQISDEEAAMLRELLDEATRREER
ncbi:BlaI/MecI/CopY family transcriptional regulator [Thermasporomyces composti]|jgi:predicted transcriptional regulator|uniref:Putative transcriptional regulator n=1 Tax=Thermasporomyces composti TaxID=696763 RepID=A0A3D9V770_THECX|nr:BlaI/MecI/CopY family transcriptional regulator [Thermasporomyces composti]REF36020.1 putative transcriptional regulator [Thermasporomyces composti]